MGLALVFFGAEGWRTPAFVSGQVDLGFTTWSAQSLFVVATCAILIVALWLFFGKTLYGRALRATAVNRRGARLMGISTTMSGSLTFTLAVAIGAMSGMLIAPITTVYYDTGFLIGLKALSAPSSAAWPAIRWPPPARCWWACWKPSLPFGPAPTRKSSSLP